LDKPLNIIINGENMSFDELRISSEIPNITAIIKDGYFLKNNNGFYKIIGELIFVDHRNIFFINATNIEFIK
jgi:hypothetical protein